MARLHTGRHKVLAAYRSYHGATAGAINADRRPAALADRAGRRPASCTSAARTSTGRVPRRRPRREECERALQHLRDTIMVEGPHTIAAIILETVVGTNGILVPPAGYLAGVRELCDEHGIVLIADEVMAGFGRCGEWFAVDHWDVTPDLITFAKGVNSGYVPLGGVVISDADRRDLRRPAFPGGLTYSGPPAGLRLRGRVDRDLRGRGHRRERRAMLGDDGDRARPARARRPAPVGRRGARPRRLLGRRARPRPGHPRAARAVQRGRRRGRADGRRRRRVQGRAGCGRSSHFNRTHVAPPCTTTPAEVREGLAVLDQALEIADRHSTGG